MGNICINGKLSHLSPRAAQTNQTTPANKPTQPPKTA